MNAETLYVGMDLGTFKTSVAGSNGRREVLPSAVGWPRDYVARAMLGREVVFGREVYEKRLALDVVRPFQRGTLKYLDHEAAGIPADKLEKHKQAAKLLVAQAVSLCRPPENGRIYGVIGAPSRATLPNKQVLIEAARGTFDAAVVVAEPFAVAFGMGKLCDTLIVDIGAGTIDLCPMYGVFPRDEDQITLPLGGDAVDDKFLELLKKKYPQAQVSLNMAREIKEKHGSVHDFHERAIVQLPVSGVPQMFDVTDPLKEACRSIVQPIIEGVREIISRFDPEFQKPLLSNVLLSGGGSQLRGLDRLIEEALKPYGGGNCTRVYDSVFAGATGALKLAMGMPAEYWQELERPELKAA